MAEKGFKTSKKFLTPFLKSLFDDFSSSIPLLPPPGPQSSFPPPPEPKYMPPPPFVSPIPTPSPAAVPKYEDNAVSAHAHAHAHSPRELPLDPADVLLLHLPGPDLLLHLPGLARVPPEEEQPRRQPVQTVDRPEVLEAVLLGQDEHHRVVAVATAGVDLGKKKILINTFSDFFSRKRLDLGKEDF